MTFPCDVCNDYGVIFLGNNDDYDVEGCGCANTPDEWL